jgi:hypothetical protein
VPPFHSESTWWTGTQEVVGGPASYPAELLGAARIYENRGARWDFANNDRYTAYLVARSRRWQPLNVNARHRAEAQANKPAMCQRAESGRRGTKEWTGLGQKALAAELERYREVVAVAKQKRLSPNAMSYGYGR